MTALPVVMTNSIVSLDFSTGSLTYGSTAQKLVSGVWTMRPGDATRNLQVTSTGSNNDRDAILTKVGISSPTNVIS